MERQKWGSNRVRVTRACDRCKRRKIRCTGRHPCEICLRINLQCTFNAAYTRGRHPPPPEPVEAPRELELLGRKATSFSPVDSTRVLNLSARSLEIAASDFTPDAAEPAPEPPSRSPEPTQTDLQGHYVGPASGVSFLLGVQKRLHQSGIFSNASSIFTFGDTPLPYIDPTYCIIPARDETAQLLQRYFDFTVPVDRFLHRPTVEELLSEFYETSGAMKSKDEAPSSKALLFMVFALSQEHISPKLSDVTTNLSVRYFLAADHLLSKERGAIRLISIQARLCQCLWLLSQSRINHCWSLFGTTARLALAIGLHLSRDANQVNGLNHIDIECRRRTFWCAYSLDNYLSTALGRPRIFHDPDIDQEMPSCVDDSEIHATHTTTIAGRSQSLMLAPVAYFKLGRILSMILRDMYSIRPPSSADRYALATKHSLKLKSWREQISGFLDSENANTALLIPIFRRQRNVLNLAYWHTMMLTHRPFLLRKFRELQSDGENSNNQSKSQIDENVWECLTAAMNIVKIVDNLAQAEQMFQAFWFTSYFAFSAIVVLYVYTIQQSTLPVETYENYFTAATRCQNHLSNVAKEGSLAARYCLILGDLRTQVLKQTEGLQREPHSLPDDLMDNSAANGADFFSSLNDQMQIPPQESSAGEFEVVASGQFNPMITAAFGGLEPFLYNDMLWS